MDNEDSIIIERSEKFIQDSKILSDFIAKLDISHEENEKLIQLIINLINERAVTALKQGVNIGIAATKEAIS